MNVEELRALFAGETATRLKTIVDRLDEIDGELQKLGQERADLDAELKRILSEIGHSEPRKSRGNEQRKRRCKLCGREGHIVARKKTADGRDTCPTYPEGKPLAAE
jgi:DNA repair exonuclease SbcCD ATPase subunit